LSSIGQRLAHAWNAFQARDKTDSDIYLYRDTGYIGATQNPSRVMSSPRNERSILTTITNRIALDVASFNIEHVKIDENGQYLETIDDHLNQCLRIEANKDQTGRALIQDIVMSMFDEGSVAVVPVETSINPTLSGSYNIFSIRTGKIVEWYPNHVRVEVYNDRSGRKERILMPKNLVGIIENPLYSIMNEPNSTLKRLIRKLSLLDSVDEATSSGKLDIIIQLPYTIKSEARQLQAEDRARAIEQQLKGSRYGIAYVDATEHITQLNRPAESNLLSQIQYLTLQFYNQLGFTEDIFNGKATEQSLRNYYDRTIEPIVTAIVEELRRKFLTKTARTQGQTIMGFRDVFRLIPANEIANIADAFSRNEILTPNELRQIVGRKPSDAPHASELQNRNMPTQKALPTTGPVTTSKGGEIDVEDQKV
jgi:ribosomal protein L21E